MLFGSITECTFSGNVPNIFFNRNQLTGMIPFLFGNYNFSGFDFSYNMLSNDVSFMFGSNKIVQIAWFSNNVHV